MIWEPPWSFEILERRDGKRDENGKEDLLGAYLSVEKSVPLPAGHGMKADQKAPPCMPASNRGRSTC